MDHVRPRVVYPVQPMLGFPFSERLTTEHSKYHIPAGDLLWKESKGASTVSESESEISL